VKIPLTSTDAHDLWSIAHIKIFSFFTFFEKCHICVASIVNPKDAEKGSQKGFSRNWSSKKAEKVNSKEENMPFINVKLAGIPPTAVQKAEIIAEFTDTLVRVLGKNPATTVVIIEEVPSENWGIGGETVAERNKKKNNTI
jgi:4-oxalocrotonate tautomerase